MHGTFNEAETAEDAELQGAIAALRPVPAGVIYTDAEINEQLDARLTPNARAILGLKNITSVARRDVRGINELGLDGVKQFPIADAELVYRTPAQRWDDGAKWVSWHWRYQNEQLFFADTFDAPTFRYSVRGFSCSVPGYTTLWTVGRRRGRDGETSGGQQGPDDELLMLNGGPLLFTGANAAQTMAQLAHPQPIEKKSGLRWMVF